MIYKITKAKSKDSSFFYLIRNSKDIRKNSIHNNRIKLKDHNVWFTTKLKEKNYFFYILQKGGLKIGYIRLKKYKNYMNVSIAIKKQYRGKNYSSIFLDKVHDKFAKQIFVAEVIKKNLTSFYFFKKKGYSVSKITKKSYFMKKLNNQKKYLKIIDQISNVRKKNNNNWMDILKIAFKNSPEESSKIMKKIFDQDTKISNLSKKLTIK